MKPVSTFYFVLLLSLSSHQIFALRLHRVIRASDLITEVCDHTRYKDLCKSSLESFSGSKTTDLQGLAQISLKIASMNATKILEQINELLSNPADDLVEQALTDCTENYADAVAQFEDSMAALDSNTYQDINTWVAAAMADAITCEEGFAETQSKSSLTAMNKIFGQLCSISLSIVNLLAKK